MRMTHLKTKNKRSNVCVRKVIGILVTTVILSFSGNLLVFADGPAKNPEVLLDVLLDESTPYRDRVSALQDTYHLSNKAKAPLFLRLIREGDDRLAMTGGFMAIRQGIHTPDIISAIRVRISKWTLPAGPGIVQGLVQEGLVDDASAEAVIPIIRDVLRLTASRQPPSDAHQHELAVIAVNWAGFALAGEGKAEDGDLFRDAVSVYPEAYIGWLALYKLNAMNDTMYGLAREVYSDEQTDNLVRIGAAVAAQKTDENATSVGLEIIQAYLQEFSHPLETLYPKELTQRAATQLMLRMANGATVLAFLPLLEGDQARALAVRYIDSPNDIIAEYVRLVTARHWPDEVKPNLANVSQEARATTMAMLGYFHPNRKLSSAMWGVSDGERQAARDKLVGELSIKTEVRRLLLDW